MNTAINLLALLSVWNLLILAAVWRVSTRAVNQVREETRRQAVERARAANPRTTKPRATKGPTQ